MCKEVLGIELREHKKNKITPQEQGEQGKGIVASKIKDSDSLSMREISTKLQETLVCQGEDSLSFQLYFIYVFQLKRWCMRLWNQGKCLTKAQVIGLELKGFFEYFPAIPSATKVKLVCELLDDNVFFELEPSTMVSLLNSGVDVDTTSTAYNIGLDLWHGSWTHFLATKEVVLQRQWFSAVTSFCSHKEGVTESVLDQVLNSDVRIEVKYYNTVLSLAMGCEVLTEDFDSSSLQLLSAATHQVLLTEEFARMELAKHFHGDMIQLISEFYVNDWHKMLKTANECYEEERGQIVN